MEYKKFPAFRKYAVAGIISGAVILGSVGFSYAQMPERLSPEECKRLEEEKDETKVFRNTVRGTRYSIAVGGKILRGMIPPTDPYSTAAKVTLYVLEKSCTIPMKYFVEKPATKKIERLEMTIEEKCGPEDKELGEYDGSSLTGDTDDLNNGFKGLADQLSGDSSGEAENACRDHYNPLEKIKIVSKPNIAALEKRPDFKKKYTKSATPILGDQSDMAGEEKTKPAKRSVNETNEILWDRHPGLERRQLTKGEADRGFRQEWISIRDYGK